MDDINVGDRRTWRGGGSLDEHEVLEVASFAVDTTAGRYWRPEYDGSTEPVPAAPTFERGDVVVWNTTRTVGSVVSTDPLRVASLDYRVPQIARIAGEDWVAPTGHKVATIDEGAWYVVYDNGVIDHAPGRRLAEFRVAEYDHIIALATVRDGHIVQPVIIDGVEHLVACNSEPRP